MWKTQMSCDDFHMTLQTCETDDETRASIGIQNPIIGADLMFWYARAWSSDIISKYRICGTPTEEEFLATNHAARVCSVLKEALLLLWKKHCHDRVEHGWPRMTPRDEDHGVALVVNLLGADGDLAKL